MSPGGGRTREAQRRPVGRPLARPAEVDAMETTTGIAPSSGISAGDIGRILVNVLPPQSHPGLLVSVAGAGAPRMSLSCPARHGQCRVGAEQRMREWQWWAMALGAIPPGRYLAGGAWSALKAAYRDKKARSAVNRHALPVARRYFDRAFRRRLVKHHAAEAYARTVFDQSTEMTIHGMSFSLPIDQCFVPLELRSGSVVVARSLLETSGIVVVTGEPGAGKTALFARLTRSLAANCLSTHGRGRIPVSLPVYQLATELEGYASTLREPAEAFEMLLRHFKRYHSAALQPLVDPRLLETAARHPDRGVVVLLDGLDEIATERLIDCQTFVADLADFLSACEGDNLVLVAARQQVMDMSPTLGSAGGAQLSVVELKPFSTAAIFAFLLRYPYSHADPTAEAARLFTYLRLNPSLLETCGNPLALALFVRSQEETVGGLSNIDRPQTRAGFYKQVVSHLIYMRKFDRENRPRPSGHIQDLYTRFFIDLAAVHVKSRDAFNQIPTAAALNPAEPLAVEREAGIDTLNRIAVETGLIRSNNDDTWSFVHRSFLDYFIGQSLSARSSESQIEKMMNLVRRDPRRYEEAFYFACGLMTENTAPQLPKVLESLARNTFLIQYYPRACVESQRYVTGQFEATIGTLCALWKADQDDAKLLRHISLALIDYEKNCLALGQTPKVTLVDQLGADLTEGGRLLLDSIDIHVQLALGASQDVSLDEILGSATVEDAVVWLYDANGLGAVTAAAVRQLENDRYHAVLAEAALRSSLVARHLVDSTPTPARSRRFRQRFHRDPWAEAWPIRGTLYSEILDKAVGFVRSLPPRQRQEFPHLSMLLYCKPRRRLRYEILAGSGRISVFLAGTWLILAVLSAAAISSGLLRLGAAVLLGVGLLLVAWRLVHTGRFALATPRILNVSPNRPTFAGRLGFAAVLAYGPHKEFPPYGTRPRLRYDGSVACVYETMALGVWRRFAPSMGDGRLSRSACSEVQQWLTEDVRDLLQPSSEPSFRN